MESRELLEILKVFVENWAQKTEFEANLRGVLWSKIEGKRQFARKERQWRKELLTVIKGDLVCVRCGQTDHINFRHRDQTTNKFKISEATKRMGTVQGIQEVIIEIAKCDMLCDFCNDKMHKEMIEGRTTCPNRRL